MKKFILFITMFLAFFANQGNAQIANPCNPSFNAQFLSGNTVKFTPAIVTDSPFVQHYWIFGDASSPSSVIRPTHTFTANGVFVVKHYVIRHNQNNVTICTDSALQTITIQQATCNLVASFTSSAVPTNPLSRLYTNTSSGFAPTDSARWTFSDGSISTALNPVHTYAAPGIYTVCLRVKKPNNAATPPCVSDICRLDTVVVPSTCNIQAFFTSLVNSGQPNTISFTNQSPGFLPTDSIFWNFGDGTPILCCANTPNHTYANPGTYNVCIKIKRNTPAGSTPCIREYCKTIVIENPCTLVANFTWYRDSLPTVALYSYHFTNTSAPLSSSDSIRWTFGDGTSSNQVNPMHVYAQPGTYTVCLRVIKRTATGALTTCISEKCYQVVVTPLINICNIQAYFTSLASATQPNIISFTNQSPGYLPTDSIFWNFGDGSPIVCCVNNPTHTYTTAGTYNVCIRIKRNTVAGTTPCIREYCKLVTVTIPCNLVANFTWFRDSLATIPFSYHFTNTSAPLSSSDSIRWTFGDGTSSNQVNPVKVYTQPGTYTVCLRVIKRNPNGVLTNCISEKCYQVVVSPITNPCNIQAYFTSLASATQPNTISFTNQSPGYLPTDSIFWNFGDGSPIVCCVNNPTHTYTTAGTFNVCIRIKRNTVSGTSPCIREYCKLVTVTIPCNLAANFTWYRNTSPTVVPNTYHFTNTSAPLSNTDSIRWTFGDGTSSNQVNPVHVFAQPGTYTVCLRVIKRGATGALTTCISEKCYTIVVPVICTIQSNFTWAATAANFKTIVFTNTSVVPATGATAVWSFGDGTTAATWNATHTYAQAGRYAVCLRTQLGTCISYKCDSITVVAPQPACNQLSLFTFVRSTSNGNTITFTPNYISNNIQYTWTFGDGTGSQGATSTHQFTNSGYYTVCLTAFKNNTCASTTCSTIYIAPNCNDIIVGFNDVRDSLVPNRVRFVATSNIPTTNQVWTITKVPTTPGTGTITIQANNPTYVFLDSGYYRVCLKATFANGCIKEYCRVIRIAHSIPVTNSCTLQLYPNPASSIVNAHVTLAQPLLLNALIYNTMNMLVAQKQQQGIVGNNIVSINIANLPAGIYTLRLLYGNQVCTQTFVKQ